jgi:hypothetical protein
MRDCCGAEQVRELVVVRAALRADAGAVGRAVVSAADRVRAEGVVVDAVARREAVLLGHDRSAVAVDHDAAVGFDLREEGQAVVELGRR